MQMLKAILVFAIPMLLAAPSFAKISINSVCYLENNEGSQMQGENTQQLFEIASVSKVFVTYWALQQLKAQFRFATGVHVTPVDASTVDVHLEGSLDPFFGRQLTHFLVSELARVGVRQVRTVTFDENFKLRWSVLTKHEMLLDSTPEEIASGLLTHLKALAKEYPQSAKDGAQVGVRLTSTAQVAAMKFAQVAYLPKASFQKQASTVSFALKSAPLYRYLKEMNIVSNNHVADKLYDYLGGAAKFQAFFANTLKLDTRHLQFVNGSGNSLVVGQDPTGKPLKQYNKATCDSLIQVLIALQNELARQNLDLTSVMAVSKSDQGTMSPRYDGMPNTIVAKTGTVDPAVTMAGVISTEKGNIYYGVLLRTEGVADWERARDRVRSHVYDLIARFGGAQRFDYQGSFFTPYDASSRFEGPAGLSLSKP